MKLNKSLLFAVILPVSLVTIGVTATTRLLPRSQPASFISLPSRWVAFDADYVSRESAGTVKLAGRYFQGSDGSWRQDGTGVDGKTITQIVSLAEREAYTSIGGKPAWIVQRLDVPASGRPVPHSIRASMSGLTKLAEPYDGHEAFEYRELGGTVSIRVPDLNWFSVSSKSPDGDTRVFSNIQIRAQDDALFQLPQGAAVEYSDKVMSMGMVRHSRVGNGARH